MIVELKPVEHARLDHGRIVELGFRLGPVATDDLISNAMEELAVAFARIQRAYGGGRMDDLQECALAVEKLANSVGMTTLSKVAEDVAALCGTHDSASLGATTARLVRVGEMSLMAVWDLSDVSI